MVFQKGYTPYNKGVKKGYSEAKKYYNNKCNYSYCHNPSKSYFCSIDCKLSEATRRQTIRDLNPQGKRKKKKLFNRLVKEFLNEPLININ